MTNPDKEFARLIQEDKDYKDMTSFAFAQLMEYFVGGGLPTKEELKVRIKKFMLVMGYLQIEEKVDVDDYFSQ